jgi:hypothetical protein
VRKVLTVTAAGIIGMFSVGTVFCLLGYWMCIIAGAQIDPLALVALGLVGATCGGLAFVFGAALIEE